jgi:integrase
LSDELVLVSPGDDEQDVEGRLISLVLNAVTSANSRRAYAAGLRQFFSWTRTQPPRPFSKALVQEYRTWLNGQKLSPATVNLRLSPIRKLAQEMVDNGLLDAALARGIENVPGVKQAGIRVGNWLIREQASELLNAPDPETLGGLRDRAILALLVGCGLRRAEILSLEVNQIQQREGRWVIPDLVGKGKRRRTVRVPAWVKVRIEEWVLEADIYKGRLFRPVTKGGKLAGESLSDEKRSGTSCSSTRRRRHWENSLPTICGGLARSCAARQVGISSRFRCCWGMRRSRPPSAIWAQSRT